MIEYFAFCGVGRILIYTAQKFPFTRLPIIGKFFRGGELLGQLLECDFCLGVWVFLLLSAGFRFNLLSEWAYIPILSELITAAVTSFLVHLLRIGWQGKFSAIVVE